MDTEGPILTQDKDYFFSKIPAIKQYMAPPVCVPDVNDLKWFNRDSMN